MKNKGFGIGFLLGVIAAGVLATGIAVGIYFAQPKKTTVSELSEKKMNLMEQVIDAYYFGKIDQSKMTDGTYKGLVAGLGDQYSEYYTKDEYKSMLEDNAGKYVGIGALVSKNEKNGIISIQRVFKSSPAEKAGLKRGDIIVKVNGKDVTGEDLSKVVLKIKGEENTKVKLKILDKKKLKYKNVTLVRKTVDVPTVESKMIDKKNKIGYVEISEFDANTVKQFKKNIAKLKKQKVKGIIFDLRYNPGGMYDTVCQILDDILPKGTIVFTKDKYGKRDEVTSNSKSLKLPIVVLQNEGSASASEIFAGAVQDFKAGTIVGTQSYGKGVVQNTYPFSDGSALKLTVKKYFTPSGKNINGKGIAPDVKVDNTGKKDKQLDTGKKILIKKIK